MRTVRDVMSRDAEILRTTGSVVDAACYLAAHDADAAPVCAVDGTLAGTVRARDIVALVVAAGRDPATVSLSELAAAGEMLALDAETSVDEAASIMFRHDRDTLPVLEGTCVVGLVTQRDVVRSVAFRPPWADV